MQKIKLKDGFEFYTDINCSTVKLSNVEDSDATVTMDDQHVEADDCVELAEFFLTLGRKLRERE
jgi:hypothetical protein